MRRCQNHYQDHYDRRKNFYKNEGKPINRIISIPQMAQAIIAILLQRPDTARARPSSLIRRDEEYRRLFSPTHPIEVYRACSEILKQTENYLAGRTDAPAATDKNNMKFYVAMAVCQEALTNTNPSTVEIASLAGSTLALTVLDSAYQIVHEEYKALGATDQAAKGSELVASVRRRLGEKFSMRTP